MNEGKGPIERLEARQEALCELIAALGKSVPRDVSEGINAEVASNFEERGALPLFRGSRGLCPLQGRDAVADYSK